MFDIVNSQDLMVAQLKALRPGDFPHLMETAGQQKTEILSTKVCALFVRDSDPPQPQENSKP